MIYVSDTIEHPKRITAKKIRTIVEDNFLELATECGEVGPRWFDGANWLGFNLTTNRFFIADVSEIDVFNGVVWLASIDGGIPADFIGEDDDVADLFEAKCDDRDVQIVSIEDESFGYADSGWSETLLQLLKAGVDEHRGA